MFGVADTGGDERPMARPAQTSREPRRARRIGAWKGDVNVVLKWAKESAGISSKELARRLGVKDQSVGQYLQGRRRNPNLEFVVRWLATCGFDVEVVQR